jgi:hypothetical protein
MEAVELTFLVVGEPLEGKSDKPKEKAVEIFFGERSEGLNRQGIDEQNRLGDEPHPHGLSSPKFQIIPKFFPDPIEPNIAFPSEDPQLEENPESGGPCEDEKCKNQPPRVNPPHFHAPDKKGTKCDYSKVEATGQVDNLNNKGIRRGVLYFIELKIVGEEEKSRLNDRSQY